jgi:hypothetical protein
LPPCEEQHCLEETRFLSKAKDLSASIRIYKYKKPNIHLYVRPTAFRNKKLIKTKHIPLEELIPRNLSTIQTTVVTVRTICFSKILPTEYIYTFHMIQTVNNDHFPKQH